ncbi:hypothetical protein ElyMa_001793500 [Elysia marginata]|uniref:Uncharacterized protein n=1 Tax=Elysia marginata TaxID=1093978 RepID=A0AAV4EF84_9GAST|nr:hypothetical protein ElyMa_001793500 [Elysia marginata]
MGLSPFPPLARVVGTRTLLMEIPLDEHPLGKKNGLESRKSDCEVQQHLQLRGHRPCWLAIPSDPARNTERGILVPYLGKLWSPTSRGNAE